MKLEMDERVPAQFTEAWPGQFTVFPHWEFSLGIPQSLFVLTSRKSNGKSNVCTHSWSSFTGSGTAYFAVLGGLSQGTHSYENILRDGVFCLNFLPARMREALERCTVHYGEETDEIAAAGLCAEDAKTIDAPRIAESFLSVECRLERVVPLAGEGAIPLLIGRVLHAAMDEDYARGLDKKYGPEGFCFNLHSPQNWQSGAPGDDHVATLRDDGPF